MAPTSVLFLTSASAASMDMLANLVEQVPSYWLDLGQDVRDIAGQVSLLVDSLQG